MKAKIMNFLIPLLAGSATTAFAADSTVQGGGTPLVWLFIGFAVLVVMVQAIPACIMLYSMVKAIFSPAESSAPVSANHGAK